MIDFRSDTFTQPTAGMLEAMRNAVTGDDIFGEDPTVNALEARAAALFGMEAALYCPSGTMSNQIGIKAHTQPGDEVICEKTSHVYVYEGGGIAFNSGCQVKLIDGSFGKITASQIRESVNPDDIHRPPSRLVSLENSTNRGGGNCYTKKELIEIRKVCDEAGMKMHLDGARLFNAMQALGQSPVDFGLVFDSISICLNKGLGCPMGSILLGSQEYIKKSRRIRKIFGGGLRQAGYMAATGLYALEHHIERLRVDHDHAKMISQALGKKDFCGEIYPVMTNIVIMETREGYSAPEISAKLKNEGILAIAMTPRHLRFVTHLDISSSMVEKTLESIQSL